MVLYECVDVICGVNGLLSGVGILLVMVNFVCKWLGKCFVVLVCVIVGLWDFYWIEVDVIVLLIEGGCYCSCFVVVG